MASQAEIDLIVNATNTLSELQRDLARIVAIAERTAPPVNVRVDVDDRGSIGRLTSSLRPAVSGLAGLAGSAAQAGLAAGAALPAMAGLATALINVAPAAAVATQGMLAMQLVSGTLKLGMMGVEEAVSTAFDPEATPEELAEAMAKLAPEAQKFVKELSSMRSGFKELQLDVQNRLFTGLDDSLRDLGRSALPQVEDALGRTADTLNRMARSTADAAVELAANGTLDKALQGTTKGLQNLEKVPSEVATAFGQLAAASAPAFDRITAKVADVATQISEKLTAAFESGALEDSIDEAIDLIGQLGDVAGNILGGVANIFGGLTTNGRDFFTILEDISQAFEDLTASEEFQTILNELALTADTLVKNVLPLLLQAFEELGPVIAILGPPIRDLLNALGEELQPVIEELGPVLVDLAIIFRDQMPFAIAVVRGALETLVFLLKATHAVLNNVVIPIVRAIANVLNSDFVQSIANVSRNVENFIPAVGRTFIFMRDAIARALASAASAAIAFVADLRSRFLGGIASLVSNAVRIFQELPGRVRNALGNLGGLLLSAGADIVRGLINGMLGQIGNLISAASRIASTVKNSIAGALDINSPSVVMKHMGEDTGQGYILGIEDTLPDLRRTVSDFALAVPTTIQQTVSPIGQRFNVASPGAPAVFVTIGNEAVDQFVTTRFDRQFDRNSRIMSQGVRR